SSTNTKVDIPTFAPTALNPKFVIRGGTVLRTPDISKEEIHIDPIAPSPGLESIETVRGPPACTDCQTPTLPQGTRSKSKNWDLDKNSANISDTWSTEDEVDDSHVGGGQVEVQGLVTDPS